MKLTVKHIIIVEFILCIGIVLFTLLNAQQWVSRCFLLSFIILVPSLLFVYRGKYKHTAFMSLILLVTLACVLINGINLQAKLSVDGMIFLFVFAALLIYIQVMQGTTVTKKLCDFVVYVGILMSVIFVGAYFLANIRTTDKYLTMNYSNSNLLGMWILQAILFSVVGFFHCRQNFLKLVCVVTGIANGYLLSLTGARNAYLALGLGFFVFLISFLRKKHINNAILAVVAIFPLIFLAFYMFFQEFWENSELLQAIFLNESKELGSRYELWKSTFYNMKGYWFTGAYFKLAGNVHNSHLVLLSSYGVVVLALTVVYLYRVMKSVNQCAQTPYQKLCMVAFCVTIFMGNAEGALFSGAVGLYIPACAFLLLARYELPDAEKGRLFPKIRILPRHSRR